jgi:hypothetical protein
MKSRSSVLSIAAALALLLAAAPLAAQVPGLRYEPLPLVVSSPFAPSLLAALPTAPSAPLQAPATMPKAYAYDELGLFCKWEVKMEKSARLPIKVRLGEVQYVERMEGKGRGW